MTLKQANKQTDYNKYPGTTFFQNRTWVLPVEPEIFDVHYTNFFAQLLIHQYTIFNKEKHQIVCFLQ